MAISELDIPNKNNGDLFTAPEVNAIAAKINELVEGLNSGTDGPGGGGGGGKVSMATGISGSGSILTNAAFAGKTINMVSNKANGNLYAGEDFTQTGSVLTFTNGTMYDTDTLYYFY